MANQNKPIKDRDVCAVIIAAGTSSRMGQLKQLLPLGDKYLLEHVINKVLKYNFSTIYTVIGSRAEEIKSNINIKDSRFQWIINDDYQNGQSTSIKKALQCIKKDYKHVMIFLGDLPFIKLSTIDTLYKEGETLLCSCLETFILRPAVKEKQGHPVFIGNISNEMLKHLEGDSGFKNLQYLFSYKKFVEVNDAGIHFDIDTKEQYQEAVSKYHHYKGEINNMIRYEYGGDDFIFVELSEEMSLEANFKGMAITKQLKEENLSSIVDICPGNASFMIRFIPEEIHPDEVIEKLKVLEREVSWEEITIDSRIVEVPIFFEDPWTHEVMMKFRSHHQDPESTDLEYAARINGYDSKEELIKAMTDEPYLVSMIGFVPGLPWCYQMVPQERQIEVPKYVRPRTFTPERAFGFGGAFSVIYPVDGAGGYQLFGIAAAPIFEKEQKNKDFKDNFTFPRQGDIFQFKSITREEYDEIRKEVEEGTFEYLIKEFSFKPQEVLEDTRAFSKNVTRRLYK